MFEACDRAWLPGLANLKPFQPKGGQSAWRALKGLGVPQMELVRCGLEEAKSLPWASDEVERVLKGAGRASDRAV